MEHSKEELHFLSQELASKTDEFSDLMESEQGIVQCILDFFYSYYSSRLDKSNIKVIQANNQ